MKLLYKIPFIVDLVYPTGWNLRSNVRRYHQNSTLQKEWAFDLIGKYHKFNGSEKILDVGSGDGKISYLLSRLGKKVTGIDISAEMIDFSNNQYGHYENVEFLLNDKNQAWDSIKDKSMDVITCFCMLHLVPNPAQFLSHLKTKVKPGGKIIFTYPIPGNPAFAKALSIANDQFNFAAPKKTDEQKKATTAKGMSLCLKKQGFDKFRIETTATKNAFSSRATMIDWFIGTYSANINLPHRMERAYNTTVVNTYLKNDTQSKGPRDVVYYNVSRIDGVIEC